MQNSIKKGFFKQASAYVEEREAVWLWKQAILANDQYMMGGNQQQNMLQSINTQPPQATPPAQILNAFGKPSVISQSQAPQTPGMQPQMQMSYNANLQQGPNEYSSPLEVKPNASTPLPSGISISTQTKPSGSGVSVGGSGISSTGSSGKSTSV